MGWFPRAAPGSSIRRILATAIVLATLATGPAPPAAAQQDAVEGYTLALSWSPTWCASDPDARRSPQCEAEADHRFVVHGLWPNRFDGRDAYCRTGEPGPDRRTVNRALAIMPDRGLIAHQWRKHGTCSGLDAAAYFEMVEEVFDEVVVPPGLATLDDALKVRPEILREAFAQANPWIDPDGIFVRCRDDRLVEVRLCLSASLASTPCSNVASRRCRASLLDVPAPR